MTPKNIISGASVIAYYNYVIRNKAKNNEGLFLKINNRFEKLIEDKGKIFNTGLALDYGYGYGNYSVKLAEYGYRVIAIDKINPDIFRKRVKLIGLKEKIKIAPNDNILKKIKKIDIIVCVNVLHFLSKSKIIRLLKLFSSLAGGDGIIYLVIFSDINRMSHGRKKYINNEANIKTMALDKLINKIFSHKTIKIYRRKYVEKDKMGIYFTAVRNNYIIF